MALSVLERPSQALTSLHILVVDAVTEQRAQCKLQPVRTSSVGSSTSCFARWTPVGKSGSYLPEGVPAESPRQLEQSVVRHWFHFC